MIDVATLHRLLICDPDAGTLHWRERTPDLFKPGNVGSEAVCRNWNGKYSDQLALNTIDPHGYRRGAIFGRNVQAHRVIWAMHSGYWPADEIDHINGVRHDNRLVNLRVVTRAQNAANGGKRPSRKPASRFIGVFRNRNGWMAQVGSAYGKSYGGTFRTEEDAARARDTLAVKIKGEFARLNFPESRE